MKFSTLVLCSVGALAQAAPAWAHIELLAPKPRVPDTDSIKSSPCGPMPRNNARVTTFRPGEMVTLEWEETIPHPGYFRVLLDEDGQNDLPVPSMDSFTLHKSYYNSSTKPQLPGVVMGPKKEGNTWVLADYWGQHPAGGAKKWSLKVTLPNVTCTNCTLQLVQSMFEGSRSYSNAYYYHCADLVIAGQSTPGPDAGTGEAEDAGAPMEDAGGGRGGQAGQMASGGRGGQAGQNASSGGDDGEGGDGGEGNGGEDGKPDDDDSEDSGSKGGGCTFAGAATTTPAWAALLALLPLLRRRGKPRS